MFSFTISYNLYSISYVCHISCIIFHTHILYPKDLANYVRPIQKLGGECIYGPPYLTEAWQAVDSGHVGACIKAIAKEKMDIWMMKPYTGAHKFETETFNWQVWEQNKISAKEKRILMTWVYGEAWDQFCTPKYDYFRRRAMEKCGLLITESGKNDHQVTAEGIEATFTFV